MPSAFFGLEIAKRGLISAKISQDVISHNIVNANTPSYSKQRAELSTTIPFPYPTHNREIIKGLLGTGVNVEAIIAFRDKVLENKINESISQTNYFYVINDKLSEIESFLNEPESPNLNNMLNDFFNAVNDIANNPENLSLRKNLINTAIALTKEFKFINNKFEEIIVNFNEEIKTIIENINSIALNIKEINLEIFKTQNLGYNPNDLIDKRTSYLNELSKFINFTATEMNNGIVKIEINGHILVGENYTVKLTTAIDSITNKIKPVFEDNMDLILNSGCLKAILDIRDNYLPKYENYINEIATVLINNVNMLHQNGYSLNAGIPSGISFFQGDNYKNISVNEMIIDNPALFAAAKNPFSPGDGLNAIEINNLKNNYLALGGTATISEVYRIFISELGIDNKIAEETKGLYDNLKLNLLNKRENISGVSLDEELVELIKFQHAFSANLKVFQTQDEILESIINIIR